jgi:ankyrin repeat protein
LNTIKLCLWWRLLLVVIALGACVTIPSACRRVTVASDQQTEGAKKLSPLMDAARKGDLFAVRKLLRAGVDVNAMDTDGNTALKCAAESGNIAVVQALLGAGANVRAQSADGYTALHAAAVEREVRIVELLLAAGADVNARTKNNVTPLMSSIGSPYSDPKVSLVLIRGGADVNAADPDGRTALWIATTDSTPEVMEELLKRHADPNVQPRTLGPSGDTPLHMAAMNGLKTEVELLLRYGADPTIRNANGETPADVANPKFPEIKEILSKHSRGEKEEGSGSEGSGVR